VRVVLQAETGRRAGHRIWLGANQRVFVGGTEWAEFAVPGDPQLGQFVVETDYEHCQIRNVHTDLALFVNGIKTQSRTLVNGDIVTAGSTRFSVGIQESAEIERRQEAISAITQRPAALEMQYRFERCESGLLRFYGADALFPAAEIARQLSRQYSFYLIAHMHKAGIELPRQLTRVVDLTVRGEVNVEQLNPSSLVLLSSSDPVERFQLLDSGWNRDAIIGIFATGERPAVIKSLSRAALWVYPAHIIRDQLAAGTGTILNDLFRGIKAILIESPVAGGWEVFANPQVDPLWMQLGFPNPPATQASNSSTNSTLQPSTLLPGTIQPGKIQTGSHRSVETGSSRTGFKAGSARPDAKNVRPA